jgi:ABC-type multidrug transport system fused ATPase/permease subunit
MTDPAQGTGAGLRDLFGAILAYTGRRALPALLVVALAAVLEGAGLVLLLPVAETLFAEAEGARSGITGDVLLWLDGIGIATVTGRLAVMGGGFLALVGLRAMVLQRRDVLMTELAHGFVDHTRREFFTLLAHADWPVIKRFRKSHLLDTMTTNIGRVASTRNVLSSGIVTLAMALAYMGAAFLVSVVLGLALLALIAIGAVSAAVWSRRSHRLGRQLNRANSGVMQETSRFLDGMKAAKAARAEDELTARFANRIAATRGLAVAYVAQAGRLRNAVQLVGATGALAVLLVGYGLVGLSGGELLVMAAIVLRLSPALISTFGGLQAIAHALPAFESIRETEAALRHAQQAVCDPATAGALLPGPPADAALQIENCRVDALDTQGERVTLVRIARATIAPATLVHVSGPSGAGKSSLVELIAGLHLPAAGTVSRGDFVLDAASRRAWQEQVSFAPQEPFLFDGTVRENLLWPNLRADDAAIRDALEQAEAADIMRGLSAGLDEELLDGGARLSGGERQRLCLARARWTPHSNAASLPG